jgi:hypothetical protein
VNAQIKLSHVLIKESLHVSKEMLSRKIKKRPQKIVLQAVEPKLNLFGFRRLGLTMS